jgi:hypothetical protein
MEGKLGWLQSVTELNLTECQDGVCGPLVELQIMPSLRSLSLPASCAESTVDAEAVYGLTTLTKLRFLDLKFMTCGSFTSAFTSPWGRWASGCWT